jgi:hypothetical protein
MKRLDCVIGAIGLTAVVLVGTKIGWAGLLHQLSEVRGGLLVLIGLSFLRLGLQTTAWFIALGAQGISASVSELVGIRLAAQSIGYLSVFGPAIAEPIKLQYLMKYRQAGAIATLADAGAYGFTACLFGILGCACSGLVIAPGKHAGALLALGAGLLAGIFLLIGSKPLLAPLRSLLGPKAPGWLRYGEEVELEVRSFWRRCPAAAHRMFWLDLGCQLLFACDIVAVFWCLGIPLHAVTILALETCSRATRMIAGWMPARLGVDELGAAAAFAAIGLPAASGIALALSRRLRDLIGCILGIGWLLCRAKSSGNVMPKNICHELH